MRGCVVRMWWWPPIFYTAVTLSIADATEPPTWMVQQTQLRLGQVTGTRLFEALPDFCTVFFDPHPLF